MNWPEECTVVIPCLNEAATIGGLIGEIRQILPSVLVVDDGSTDETSLIARRAGAAIIRHEETAGKGASLKEGWRWASDHGFSWALSMDGDGQHDPGDISRFLERAANSRASLIVGNRMLNSPAIPWLRRRVNVWMSERLSHLTGRALPDTQCGFRMMELRCWTMLRLQTSHYEIESELLVRFLADAHLVEFIPIRVIYSNQQSKIKPVLDTLRWFRWWQLANRMWKINLSYRPPVREEAIKKFV
ncbi:MAG: glycosyltransferase family 2 protein [Verrucomicrobiota bacterium]